MQACPSKVIFASATFQKEHVACYCIVACSDSVCVHLCLCVKKKSACNTVFSRHATFSQQEAKASIMLSSVITTSYQKLPSVLYASVYLCAFFSAKEKVES